MVSFYKELRRHTCLEQSVKERKEEDEIRKVSRSQNKLLSAIIRTLDFILIVMQEPVEGFEQVNDMV